MKLKKNEPLSLYSEIKKLIELSKSSVIKTVNYTMVHTYFHIGRMIVEFEQKGEKRAEYAKETLISLSFNLSKEFGRGFSVDNLENMRKFYLVYSKSETLSRKSDKAVKSLPNSVGNTKPSFPLKSETDFRIFQKVFPLSWSHYLFLVKLPENERKFYEIEAIKQNWTLRELERQFNTSLFERLALSRDKQKIKELSSKGQIIEKPDDIVKNPYVLEFLGLKQETSYSENDLETAIINKIEHFLLELGKGFLFVGRQQRFTFAEEHFFVDLVFYNRLLKCFVLIDLKIGKLKHQDIGQMQMYVNYYDRIVKSPEENKTIGIILCKEAKKAVVEFTLPDDNKQIFASRYQLYLPSKKELIKQLEDVD